MVVGLHDAAALESGCTAMLRVRVQPHTSLHALHLCYLPTLGTHTHMRTPTGDSLGRVRACVRVFALRLLLLILIASLVHRFGVSSLFNCAPPSPPPTASLPGHHLIRSAAVLLLLAVPCTLL